MLLFTGTSNPELSHKIADHLHVPIGEARVGRFSDGEINVNIKQHVRGQDVFILQSTSAPTNDNIMELIIMADAISRSSAARITAVIPYFGYARQDRRIRSERVSISAKVVANMLTTAKINRILTMDLHSEQIQGFFDIPVDNMYGSNILVEYIKKNLPIENITIVSPDIGGVQRARAFAKMLNTDLAIIDKRRPEPNRSEVMNIIGNIEGKTCLIVDDMIDTGGSLANAANALQKKGANRVFSCATHAVCSGDFTHNINNSFIEQAIVTDTIRISDSTKQCKKIVQVSIASIIAECIRRVSNEESLSALFSVK